MHHLEPIPLPDLPAIAHAGKPVRSLSFNPLTDAVPKAKLPRRYLYIAGLDGRTKIGVSAHPVRRVRSLGPSYGLRLLAAYIAGPFWHCQDVEGRLLKVLAKSRIGVSEWVDLPVDQVVRQASALDLHARNLEAPRSQRGFSPESIPGLFRPGLAEQVSSAADTFESYLSIGKLVGLDHNEAIQSANSATLKRHGIDFIAQLEGALQQPPAVRAA